jgi:hypothetical protein
VPAGVVGDKYWIYLNGDIVSAPPHATSDPTNHDLVVLGPTKGGTKGWEIWTAKGRILKGQYGTWDDSILVNNFSVIRTLHIFQAVKLSLPAGKYVFEVAFLSHGSSFPFVITQKTDVDLPQNSLSEYYSGIPDDWSDTPEIEAVPTLCNGSSPPDTDQLKNWIKAYTDDKMVTLLRGAVSQPEGVVELNLPAEQGGSREFDASQIGYIVDRISYRHRHYNQRDIADCRRRYPQFSESYAAYATTISVVEKDIESFRKLAAELKGGH